MRMYTIHIDNVRFISVIHKKIETTLGNYGMAYFLVTPFLVWKHSKTHRPYMTLNQKRLAFLKGTFPSDTSCWTCDVIR